uniref:Conserved oligomeric Golgi complex subunit 5 (Fragments) n=1 Tax=Bos taurus TaxID=9913 RepID=COG5_BOVIN|nr:RecName: Full=Conserved oligomeric Golgi complex subunit 5; Short=COG complex subunit 5; AltName: Full=13S Golgi transport complex 90 kDa subunit; Short=GTC-90; AltName: Full=Component of oligomeric Golgi complex 5 [Bos taurus]
IGALQGAVDRVLTQPTQSIVRNVAVVNSLYK